MEAKGSEDETKDSKEEEPPSKVVIDLLNFAMKVVHEEMSGFFEQHCVLWDYKEEDLKKITAGEGETLEQHAVFTQYLEQINERLDGFARQAGYADAQGVLTDVQKAVDHDKKLRDQMMKEMNALFAQMRLGLEQRDKAAAGAKGTDARRRARSTCHGAFTRDISARWRAWGDVPLVRSDHSPRHRRDICSMTCTRITGRFPRRTRPTQKAMTIAQRRPKPSRSTRRPRRRSRRPWRRRRRSPRVMA